MRPLICVERKYIKGAYITSKIITVLELSFLKQNTTTTNFHLMLNSASKLTSQVMSALT